MSWVAIGAAAVGAVGAGMSADAAGDAADGQAAATNNANNLTIEQNERMRADLSPYRNMGAGATNRLSQLLGFGAMPTEAFEWDVMENEVRRLLNDPNNQFHDIDSVRQQVALGWGGQDKLRYAPNGGDYGSLLKNFTGADLQNEPGYQFGLDQGRKALEGSAAARGGLFSGRAGMALQKFGNDYGSTKFGEAFNRDSANKTRQFNFLSGSAGMGQNAAAQTGNAGQTMAQQVGANTMGMANAQGAAGIAGANAWNSAIGQGYNAYQNNELMKRLQAPSYGDSGAGMSPPNPYYQG